MIHHATVTPLCIQISGAGRLESWRKWDGCDERWMCPVHGTSWPFTRNQSPVRAFLHRSACHRAPRDLDPPIHASKSHDYDRFHDAQLPENLRSELFLARAYVRFHFQRITRHAHRRGFPRARARVSLKAAVGGPRKTLNTRKEDLVKRCALTSSVYASSFGSRSFRVF